MVSEGCGDVNGLGQAQDGDREVAQAGHDAGAVAGADLGQVLAERHVADPMESVLDGPVTAQRRCGPGTGPRRTSRRGPNGVGPRWTSDRAARRSSSGLVWVALSEVIA